MLGVRSTVSALVASLLAKDVLAAAVHRLHHDRLHARAIYTVFDDTVETVYSTVYVTIDDFGTSSTSSVANPTHQVYKDLPVVVLSSTSSTSSPAEITPQGYNVVAPLPTSSTTSTSSPVVVAVPTTLSTSKTAAAVVAVVVPTTTSKPAVIVPTTTSTPAVVVPTTTSTPAVVHATTSTNAVVSPVNYAVNPTVSASSSSSSTKKRGLAYNSAALCDGFIGSNSLVSWAYNWGSTTSGLPSGLEYVPMLWGLGSHTNGWSAAAENAIAGGSTHLLCYNEPDLTAQSNLDPKTAADGYMTYMQPFAGKAKLGAPAVTNGGAPTGLTWLASFLGACSSCQIDFITIHWYDSATNYEYFKKHIEQAYQTGNGRKIWITEFGASGSLNEQINFLQVVMPWLDAQDYVERYAYYMVDPGSLISSGSSLSELGTTFMTYTSNTISPLIAN